MIDIKKINVVEVALLSMNNMIDHQEDILKLSGDVFGIHSWALSQFMADLPDKWVLSCFAVKGGRVVGIRIVSSYLWKGYRYAHAHYMATHVDYQGKGIGSLLMEFSHDLCVKSGIYAITTETTEKLSPSLGFYEKNGYQKIADREFLQEYLIARSKDLGLLPFYLSGEAGVYLSELI